jgi:hypothetical protein
MAFHPRPGPGTSRLQPAAWVTTWLFKCQPGGPAPLHCGHGALLPCCHAASHVALRSQLFRVTVGGKNVAAWATSGGRSVDGSLFANSGGSQSVPSPSRSACKGRSSRSCTAVPPSRSPQSRAGGSGPWAALARPAMTIRRRSARPRSQHVEMR